jgi:hypothetical protein
MSRDIQVTFDAHDPRALSSFWHDVLGYVHPGPPGVDLPEDADPVAAWDDFLARVGVPEEQRNTASAIEDPDGHGPRLFFQQVPDANFWAAYPYSGRYGRSGRPCRRVPRLRDRRPPSRSSSPA